MGPVRVAVTWQQVDKPLTKRKNMKLFNNAGKFALAAAVLVSMNVVASDENGGGASFSGGGNLRGAGSGAAQRQALVGGDDRRHQDEPCRAGRCPGGDMILAGVVGAEAAYVGEYALAEWLRHYQISKTSAASYFPFAAGLLAVTAGSAYMALGGKFECRNRDFGCNKVGLLTLTALAVWIKQWRKEAPFVQAQMDSQLGIDDTPAAPAVAPAGSSSTSSSSSTPAASTDASKSVK